MTTADLITREIADLSPGHQAVLLVYVRQLKSGPSPEQRQQALAEMKILAQSIAQAGEPTMSLDEINAEVAQRRGERA